MEHFARKRFEFGQTAAGSLPEGAVDNQGPASNKAGVPMQSTPSEPLLTANPGKCECPCKLSAKRVPLKLGGHISH